MASIVCRSGHAKTVTHTPKNLLAVLCLPSGLPDTHPDSPVQTCASRVPTVFCVVQSGLQVAKVQMPKGSASFQNSLWNNIACGQQSSHIPCRAFFRNFLEAEAAQCLSERRPQKKDTHLALRFICKCDKCVSRTYKPGLGSFIHAFLSCTDCLSPGLSRPVLARRGVVRYKLRPQEPGMRTASPIAALSVLAAKLPGGPMHWRSLRRVWHKR